MTQDAILQTVNGEPTLRFERRLAHPPAKVWRAVSDPAQMGSWFPTAVEAELRPGAPMRFTFPEEAVVDGSWDGEVLEVDPPKVYMFRWNADVLRFEIIPEGDGCLLVFTQTLGGGAVGRLGAGRTAAGWDTCLDVLAAGLDGTTVEPRTDWLTPMEGYIEKFGIGEGAVSGSEVRFARDLVWKPAEKVWELLVEGSAPEVGGEPPARAVNDYVPAGELTVVDAPHVLEYRALDGGTVRWEIVSDPRLGVRTELTQTLPPADRLPVTLAAWHVHMELFFAAVMGEIRCPWPKERTERLAEHYASR
ncbi:SRPBCC domain-containing protein [Actinomadura barringtoniae]|uniref:SRPBCC domain-containing protein n=1 Tax=Actinomadura barringtoniae TaxID=1427535 RepID=A0A939PEF9_9ACTN|nr:SRPBCC family protein [Actinomadura barringtoniae]MBO2450808.1 SRPBCC domain-containing protein [Actinomadura barringtoniae]